MNSTATEMPAAPGQGSGWARNGVPVAERIGGRVFAYIIAGLRVASDLELPGLVPGPDPTGTAEVVIRAGRVPDRLDAIEARGPNWEMGQDRFRIGIPGIVRMLLTGGREIAYEIEPGVDPCEASIFLSGTGFGLLLHQLGRIVLHASAVRVGEGAVLFCGPSGAGKSTLAAALVNAGHDLLADDFCGIMPDPDGVPMVYPDGRQLKLWRHAIDRLSLADSTAEPVRPRIEKFYVEPRGVAEGALPLVAVYELCEARLPHARGIERVDLVHAAMLIRNNAYRPTLMHRMGQADLYFRGAVDIVRHAGLFQLVRPLGFQEMPSVIDALHRHWCELSLMERAA